MKKILLYISIIAIMFSLFGCKNLSLSDDEQSSQNSDSFATASQSDVNEEVQTVILDISSETKNAQITEILFNYDGIKGDLSYLNIVSIYNTKILFCIWGAEDDPKNYYYVLNTEDESFEFLGETKKLRLGSSVNTQIDGVVWESFLMTGDASPTLLEINLKNNTINEHLQTESNMPFQYCFQTSIGELLVFAPEFLFVDEKTELEVFSYHVDKFSFDNSKERIIEYPDSRESSMTSISVYNDLIYGLILKDSTYSINLFNLKGEENDSIALPSDIPVIYDFYKNGNFLFFWYLDNPSQIYLETSDKTVAKITIKNKTVSDYGYYHSNKLGFLASEKTGEIIMFGDNDELHSFSMDLSLLQEYKILNFYADNNGQVYIFAGRANQNDYKIFKTTVNLLAF